MPALHVELQKRFSARACAVGIFNFKVQQGYFESSAGFGTEFIESYRQHYSRLDPWFRHAEAFGLPGTIHSGHDLVAESELVRSRFYQEWLEPQGLCHRLTLVLCREQEDLCYFTLLRGRGEPRFGSDEILLCRTLAPHLRSAAQMRRQLARVEVERNAVLGVLDRLPAAVLLCDRGGAPVIVNDMARRILETGDGLVVRGGKLSTASPHEMTALENLIAAACAAAAGNGKDGIGALSVSRVTGHRPLLVLVAPMKGRSGILSGGNRIAATVFISDPDSAVLTNEDRLLQLFGLTRAESRLAARIAEGKSLEEAATTLNITTQTARTYIKRILSKTGTKRQVELVRLLLLSPAHLS